MEKGIALHDGYRQLKEAQQAALERLGKLLCAYDDMILQQQPHLEAQYIHTFGALEQRCYGAYVQEAQLRRKIHLVRACLNRDEQPDLAEIDVQLCREFQAYEEKMRHMEEARAHAALRLGDKPMSAAEAKRFKSLYRNLAKKLHPDLQPVQTEEVKRLWQRAMDAYRIGDLEKLEILNEIVQAQETSGGAETEREAAHEGTADAMESLRKELEKTEERTARCIAAIDRLEQEYPFKFAALLNDPVGIAAHKHELQMQFALYREQIEALEAHLALLLRRKANLVH